MAELLSIATIAGSEYAQRQRKAQDMVRAGKLDRARAETEMRAWAAIALLAGAPILHTEVARYRKTVVHVAGDGSPAKYGHLLPEAEARCDLARDLCGPNTWGPILSRARDTALTKADTAERKVRAGNLCLLARALDVPLTPASCGIANLERKAA